MAENALSRAGMRNFQNPVNNQLHPHAYEKKTHNARNCVDARVAEEAGKTIGRSEAYIEQGPKKHGDDNGCGDQYPVSVMRLEAGRLGGGADNHGDRSRPRGARQRQRNERDVRRVLGLG